MSKNPERVTIEAPVSILGLSARAIQQMASRAAIPGAAKFGRRWTFDERKLRGFVRQREEEQWQSGSERHRPERNGAVTSSIRNFRSKADRLGLASRPT